MWLWAPRACRLVPGGKMSWSGSFLSFPPSPLFAQNRKNSSLVGVWHCALPYPPPPPPRSFPAISNPGRQWDLKDLGLGLRVCYMQNPEGNRHDLDQEFCD